MMPSMPTTAPTAMHMVHAEKMRPRTWSEQGTAQRGSGRKQQWAKRCPMHQVTRHDHTEALLCTCTHALPTVLDRVLHTAAIMNAMAHGAFEPMPCAVHGPAKSVGLQSGPPLRVSRPQHAASRLDVARCPGLAPSDHLHDRQFHASLTTLGCPMARMRRSNTDGGMEGKG